MTQYPSRDWDVASAVDTQAEMLGDWKVGRARHAAGSASRPDLFDDRCHRIWAVMEATDAQLDLAEERAAVALARAPAGADHSPATFRTR